MPAEIVRADWISSNIFLLRDRGDFPIVMTQPGGANGADLLPLSLIGCSAWDVMSILLKQRQPITALAVTGECVRDPEPPWRYRAIRIHYRFSGNSLDPNRIHRAIELSETKYCSIYATLREVIALTSDFEIVAVEAEASVSRPGLVIAATDEPGSGLSQ